ncbi:MAG: hypothetical protein ABIQ16_20360 [Polyangiaceae bacterium]
MSRSALLFAFLSCFVALLLLARVKAPAAFDRIAQLVESRRFWFPSALVVLAVYAALLVLNTAYPSYLDHVEPTIASVSWLVLKGKPAYHALDSAARYTLLYGPATYLIFATALWLLGAATLSLKCMVLLLNIVMVFFLWRTFCTLVNARAALLVTTLVLLFIYVPRPNHYLLTVRADILIMSAVAVGLWGATRRSGLAGPAALAVAAAVIVDAKASGLVYTVPLFAILWQLRGWRVPICVGMSAACVALLPFLLPNVSAVAYVTWLGRAAKHPSSFIDLLSTLRTVPLLLAPLLLILGPTPWRDTKFVAFLREDGLVLATLALCFASGLLASRRIGAGSHHLLAVVPVLGYEYTRLFNALGGLGLAKRWPWQSRALCACLALVVFNRVGGGLLEFGTKCGAWRATVTIRDEVRSVLASYPGTPVEMGYGATVDGRVYLRPELVFATNHMLVDEVALSDMSMDGMPMPSATVNALETCAIWLIPRGEEPFSLPNTFAQYYPALVGKEPLFSQAFRDEFRRRYTKVQSTRSFDLWGCRDRGVSPGR